MLLNSLDLKDKSNEICLKRILKISLNFASFSLTFEFKSKQIYTYSKFLIAINQQ